MNKVLIDTNIFIYDLDRSSIHHSKANEMLQNNKLEFFTTTKNISEFFAVCSKLKIEEENTFGYYNDIIKNMTILFPDHESLAILKRLLLFYKPIGNRVYDFEVASIMIGNNILQIATFNAQDFKEIKEVGLFN